MSEEERPRQASKVRVHSGQRVVVMVDVQNMFYSAKHLHKSKLDYSKVLEGVVDGRQLVRSIAYIVQKPDVNQSGFHDALVRFGYELKVKELRIRQVEGSDRTVAKGSWDVGIATDAMMFASKVDVIALVTGDGDYAYLVETLRSLGVRVEVVSFDGSTASELVRSCDRFVPIKSEWIFAEKKFEDVPVGEEPAMVTTAENYGSDEEDPPQPVDYRGK